MRAMISAVAGPLAVAVRARGARRPRSERPPTRTPTRPPGRGQLLARGQSRSSGHADRARSARPVRRASRAGRPWPPGGRRRAPGPLGEDHQHVTLVEDPLGEPEGLDVGGAAVDRMDGAGAANQPRIGHSNISRLPSQWMRRPSRGVSQPPTMTASAFERWFAARITGPSRGIARGALDRDPASGSA